MHKSKLAGFVIDCQSPDDIQTAAKFWSAALGMKSRYLPEQEGEKYVELLDSNEQLHIEVQSVDHPSRVHLDIETDDIAAEVARLQKLGAKKVAEIRTWCVMEAPTGQRFCVVRKQSNDFDTRANTWPE